MHDPAEFGYGVKIAAFGKGYTKIEASFQATHFTMTATDSLIYLRGNVDSIIKRTGSDEVVVHTIKGSWMKEGERVCGRFEYEKAEVFTGKISISGGYNGWFDFGEGSGQASDLGLNIRVQGGDGDTSNGRAVEGDGHSPWGRYMITGNLTGDGSIVMYFTGEPLRQHR